jgi:hypothetical protein
MPSSPQQPQQSQFYNVVCGGTWLNRSQFNDAVAQSKTDNRLYTETVDILLRQNILQQERTAEVSATVKQVNLGLTDFLPAVVRPALQGVLTWLAVQLPFTRPVVTTLAPEVKLPVLPMAPSPTQSNSAMAQLLAYFFGMTKEAKPSKPTLNEEADNDREQEALKANAQSTVFSTSKVQTAGGSLLGGGGGNQQR